MTAVKVILPVEGERIAPLLDTAENYILADMDKGHVLKTKSVCYPGISPEGILNRLKDAGAGVLICGAVSRCLQREILRLGFTLIPFVSGTGEEILRGWLDGTLMNGRFSLPGCRRGEGCRHRNRSGRR